MQKKLIALAVAGLMSGAAFAQSSVVLSGELEASYTTATNDKGTVAFGKSANGVTAATHTPRIKLKGEEDLGGGNKAFFELEERFGLDTGLDDSAGYRFSRSAWIGLSNDKLGSVSFGKVPTSGDKTFGGGMIGNNDSIGDWASRRGPWDDRVDNGVLYSTPVFGPLQVHVHTAAKEAEGAVASKGIAANLNFSFLTIEGAWQRDGGAASNMYDSKWINFKVPMGSSANFYAYITKSKGYQNDGILDATWVGTDSLNEQLRYAIAADFKVGANGILRTNLGRMVGETTSAFSSDTKLIHFGIQYSHSLSKRTSVVVAGAYDRQGYQTTSTSAGKYASRQDAAANNKTSFEVALRHNF